MNLTSESLVALHDLVDILTLASSISVATAVGWYLVAMRGRVGGLVGATALFAGFVLALAAARIAAFVVTRVPGAESAYLVEAFAAGVAVVVAVAVWPLVPRLLSMPTRCELVEANRRLAEEEVARRSLVGELRGLNEDLERRVAERTRELDRERRRFEIALAGSNIAVAAQDRDLRYTWMYNAPATLKGVDPVGKMPEEILPSSTATAQAMVKNRVMETAVAERFEVELPGPTGVTWYEGRVEPLIEDGETVGVMTMSVDITRHKDHEREMRDILRELTHRSKNLLAVVQGIARQSALGAAGESGFLTAFNGRLQALSRVHEILVEEEWRGVGLRTLIERERAAGVSADDVDVEVAVPNRLVSPEVAQNLALALHELFVDARASVGSRAVIEIDWQEADDRFAFSWQKRGTPTQALTSGFARLLLQRHLPRAVDGTAELTVDDAGSRYRLEGATPALRTV